MQHEPRRPELSLATVEAVLEYRRALNAEKRARRAYDRLALRASQTKCRDAMIHAIGAKAAALKLLDEMLDDD